MENDKGKFNGTCNITRCDTGLKATWFNQSTEKYYCYECALRLNSDEHNKRDAMRLGWHKLCIEKHGE